MGNDMNTVPIVQRKDGTVPVEDEVRRLLRDAMKDSGKPREQIAGEMSQLIGRTVTASMLADFSRNGTKKRQVRFPAAWVPAFCEITGDDSLRYHLMTERQRVSREVGARILDLATHQRQNKGKEKRSRKA
jgi:hypothetical protein